MDDTYIGKAIIAMGFCAVSGVCGGIWQSSISFGFMMFAALMVVLYAGDR